MKLRALIVDDEKPARKKIRHFLESDSEIEIVGECENGAEALESIRGTNLDLIFLDIQMPLLDGFALLKRSGEKRPPAVIFVTAYDEFAIKAFDANAADYLLKPFTRKRFDEALQKVKQQKRLMANSESIDRVIGMLEKFRKEESYLRRLAVKTDQGVIFVHCEKIDWIESEDNYVLVHAGKDKHLLRESMNAMEQSLDPSQFLRIHRRILVNIDRIQEMHHRNHALLILQDGSILPVSRRMKDRVKRFLFRKAH